MLNAKPAESETHDALVVMVCSGERCTRSTQRITERDTAQTERILTRLVITARTDRRSVSSHEKRNNIAQHPCIASVPSCVVKPLVTRTHYAVPEPTLRATLVNISEPLRQFAEDIVFRIRLGRLGYDTCRSQTLAFFVSATTAFSS